MKTCTYCGRKNEDQATNCQECGVEFGRVPVPTEDKSKESDETERFERVAVLDNEVQAELIDEILSGRNLPHIMQSYYDSALDGIFQTGKGWGVILAPASAKEEILAALAEIKRQSQSSSGAPEEVSSKEPPDAG